MTIEEAEYIKLMLEMRGRILYMDSKIMKYHKENRIDDLANIALELQKDALKNIDEKIKNFKPFSTEK